MLAWLIRPTATPSQDWTSKFENSADSSDPLGSRCGMQHDGDWVYVFSVKAGRHEGPMILRRVPWDKMADQTAYQGWDWNGQDWGWDRPCMPILEGTFGELRCGRKLSGGTWAMVCLDLGGPQPNIVSRAAAGPDQVWSDPTMQVT